MHTADPQEIKAGKITDVYFSRTVEILKAKKLDKWVKAEFITKSLPQSYDWGVLAGIEECLELLQDLGVTVRAMPEGTVFHPLEPVMEIEGEYTRFGLFETALLGMICQASGIATKAARCRKLAGSRSLISFGARRMHPSLAPMVERAAFIGGCDGVAVVKSAELIQEEPVGTMPHALILVLGDTVEAVKAFHEVIDPRIKRVALIDTFQDEKFEAIRVAEAMGQSLYAVRLDTPSSRRGNFYRLLQEVRWELDLRGYRHVRLFVSGGIEEKDIVALNDLVDAYGVGTAISNAPVIDFAMDIVEVDGKPLAKRGKWSGSKRVYRCTVCYRSVIVPFSEERTACQEPTPDGRPCGGACEELLQPVIREGQWSWTPRRAAAIREYVLKQLPFYEVGAGGAGPAEKGEKR